MFLIPHDFQIPVSLSLYVFVSLLLMICLIILAQIQPRLSGILTFLEMRLRNNRNRFIKWIYSTK
jgi:hypothetical protein